MPIYTKVSQNGGSPKSSKMETHRFGHLPCRPSDAADEDAPNAVSIGGKQFLVFFLLIKWYTI